MLTVKSAEIGGIGEELGIKPGDKIISFNGLPCKDIIDYIYFDSFDVFVMTVEQNGVVTDFEVEKYPDEKLGLDFVEEMKTRECINDCVFCFVKQLPKGLRETLYVKDDDWRFSMLNGNYVTLTNLNNSEFKRIADYRISPLYISVHCTEPQLRKEMLGCMINFDIMSFLKAFKSRGIVMHAQAVIVPGLNDGAVLEKTIDDLIPYAETLAVVPVGLTKYSDATLKSVDSQCAADIIALVEKKAAEVALKGKRNYVFCADEMYIKARIPVPAFETYGEFWQIENGVGLLAKFEKEFMTELGYLVADKIGINISRELDIVTGVDSYDFLIGLLSKFCAYYPNIKIKLHKVVNNFFGETVTVSGLVTGGDIAAQLGGNTLSKTLLIPSVMLKETEDIFLDGLTLIELSEKLNVQVVKVDAHNGASLAKALLSA